MGTARTLLGVAAVGRIEERIGALVELASMRDRLAPDETATMDRLIVEVARELLQRKPGTAEDARKFLSGLSGLVPYDLWGPLNEWIESAIGRQS